MKKSALKKEFYMEIRRSMGRFVSIFFIVALGVAFYSGIRASEPSMRISGDAYFDREKLMDIKVMGTLGLTEEDVEEIQAADGIHLAEGAYSKDVLCTVADTEKVVHLLSAQEQMNRVDVVEGRMPEKAEECLVDYEFMTRYGLEIGEKITFRSGDGEPLTDSLTTDTFTIVGSGNSPLYISFSRGNSLIGNGEVSGFMIVSPEAFQMDVYTEIYVLAEDAEDAVVFTEKYDEASDAATKAVEAMEAQRCQARRQEVVDEAMKEVLEAEETVDDEAKNLETAKKELEDGKVTASNELAKAWKKLEAAEAELVQAKQQIADGERQIKSGKAELKTKQEMLNVAKAEYEAGAKELSEREEELLAAEEAYREAYETNMPLIQAGKQQLLQRINDFLPSGTEGFSTLDEAEEAVGQMMETIDGQIEQVDRMLQEAPEDAGLLAQKTVLEEQKNTFLAIQVQIQELKTQEATLLQTGQQIEEGKVQIEESKRQLQAAKDEIDDGQQQIRAAWTLIFSQERKLVEGKKELSAGQRKLEEGYSEYEISAENAAAEIADGEAKIGEGEEKLADARKEIADAKEEIESIDHPKWYVQNRSDVMSDYDGYGENADRMGTLGKVFPVLFFLVAALISLTTMTRMVEEQRTQIGTLKALGYDKWDIAKKYMYYALIATVSGSIFGVLIGEKIIPFVIIYAYKIMYKHIPDILLPYHISYAAQATVIAVCCTIAATMFSCYRELASQPAQLMRPPAPKNGKRIFLERVTWLWGKLSFTWKSSVRNMVRYKKRFFMTVFGIGGCMALMVVGFGLKDCIYEIVTLQYDEIQFYDASVYMGDDITPEEKQEIMEYMESQPSVKAVEQLEMQSYEVASKSGKKSAFLTIPKEEQAIEELFSFRSRTSKEVYHLDEQEVILTEKVSTLLDVKKGDTVTILNDEKGNKEFKVAAICENYMGNYLYMSNEVYEAAYGERPEYNSLVYSAKEGEEEEVERIGTELLKRENVLNVTYVNSLEDRLDDMLGSLNLVILVLIISAGLLAFVVLYNLNNINITERRRELATLKVLGMYDGEVAAYVFRENILLTFLSSIVGVILGDILHGFTILTVEIDNVMFGREIHLESYLFSFFLTLVFSLLINGLMYFKLKKIDMVESLKSVE